MASGNPAKVRSDLVVKEVRKGIAAGKAATLPLTPDTKVTIAGTSEDEAEFITRLILGAMNPNEDFDQFLNLTGIYTYLFMGDKRMCKTLLKNYRRWVKDMEAMTFD